MKVIAVIGSPHPEGPSARLVKEIVRGAKDAGHEVVIYNIKDMNFKGCQGCGYCKNGGGDCILKDDLKPYWKDLHECGALIVSAPNYASNVSGDMITFMNRHYCLLDGDWKLKLHEGIKLIGVFSQGSPDADAYRDNYKWFLGDFENRGMILQDTLIHTGGMSDSSESAMARRAYALGKNL